MEWLIIAKKCQVSKTKWKNSDPDLLATEEFFFCCIYHYDWEEGSSINFARGQKHVCYPKKWCELGENWSRLQFIRILSPNELTLGHSEIFFSRMSMIIWHFNRRSWSIGKLKILKLCKTAHSVHSLLHEQEAKNFKSSCLWESRVANFFKVLFVLKNVNFPHFS